MESKSGVRVPYSLTLSCMRKHLNNLNLSSPLFGQCGQGYDDGQSSAAGQGPDDGQSSGEGQNSGYGNASDERDGVAATSKDTGDCVLYSSDSDSEPIYASVKQFRKECRERETSEEKSLRVVMTRPRYWDRDNI
jgi:hypothetical protein